MSRATKPIPEITDKNKARFWSKVDKKEPHECWLWKGCVGPSGYPLFAMGRKYIFSVHRLAFHMNYGPIPPGIFVCHKCDVRNCVNPNHLFLGTTLDNMRDMMNKGRSGRAKLTAEDVRKIRIMANEAKLKTREIAAIFNVSDDAIWRITRRLSWQDVT